MKYLIIAAVALVALVSPAKAYSHSCIPECPFFHAWALTKVCRNLSFNEAGRDMLKTFDHGVGSESRKIMRAEMQGIKHHIVFIGGDAGYQSVPSFDACNQCKSYGEKEDEDTSVLSPCRFLQWTSAHGAHKN